MPVELTAVWTGDVHAPDRGLLCTVSAAHPIQPPPAVLLRGEQPTRVRRKRNRLDLTFRTTVRVRAALTEQERTIVELMHHLTISRTSVDQALKALKYHGVITSRELPRATYGRKQRIYGVIPR